MSAARSLAAALTASVFAGATVSTGLGQSPSGQPETAPRAGSSQPASTPKIVARTGAPDDPKGLAVASYRNAAGEVCLAVGRERGGALFSADGQRRVPLAEVGNCSFRPTPIAVQVTQYGDDPSTAKDESGMLMWGRAGTGVAKVRVAFGASSVVSAPIGPDGAFIARAPVRRAAPVVEVTESDGAIQRIELPAPTDPEQIAEAAARASRSAAAHEQAPEHP